VGDGGRGAPHGRAAPTAGDEPGAARPWAPTAGDAPSAPSAPSAPGDPSAWARPPGDLRAWRHLPAPAVLAASFAAGAVPWSGLAARLVAGADLRRVGSGTVSGTGLYGVAGFGPLAVAGSLDVAKGAVGPLLAGPGRPLLAAASAGAAVAGHNWSPFLGGAGGRGISPALGATLVLAPEATALLLGGLVVGRLAGETGLVSLLALAATAPLLARRRGRRGLATGVALAVPMVAKRLTGNAAPGTVARRRGCRPATVLVTRLLFDRDP
jgi:glycerol-3-phosphate acyltransferase PlsY